MTAHAYLGMYDHPAQRAANDRLWAAIADRLTARGVRPVPAALTRNIPPETLWRNPALLLGQACGYPLVTQGLPLRVLALPVYGTPGSAGARHRSLIVARTDDPARSLADFRGTRAAINDPASNTGANLLRAAIAPHANGAPFFASVTTTGAHGESLRAVARGMADIAAIDAVTFAAFAAHEPELTDRVRILAETPSSPTLPFVTSRETPVETVAALRLALEGAIADPALAEARAALFLTGLAPAHPDTFAELTQRARDAAAAGYPALA